MGRPFVTKKQIVRRRFPSGITVLPRDSRDFFLSRQTIATPNAKKDPKMWPIRHVGALGRLQFVVCDVTLVDVFDVGFREIGDEREQTLLVVDVRTIDM